LLSSCAGLTRASILKKSFALDGLQGLLEKTRFALFPGNDESAG
jgi:hypothetical protein